LRYLPEVLLIVGVLLCVAAATLAWGIAAGLAVAGVSCAGIAFVMDRSRKR
jgi:hypothetical protein